jgi:chorismate-pyruvate lyase
MMIGTLELAEKSLNSQSLITDTTDAVLLPPAVPATAMWLPASALNCYVADARLLSWLQTPGLLTERIRAAAGDAFNMQVLHEGLLQGEYVREITMSCAHEPWLFAHTRIPARTAEAHPWLIAIGRTTLGEALAARSDLQRAAPRYTRLEQSWVMQRALHTCGLITGNLWIRHSAFNLELYSFDLYEVFMPAIATAESSGVVAI